MTVSLALIVAVVTAFVMHAAGVAIPVNVAGAIGAGCGTAFGYALGRGQIVSIR